MIGERQAVNRDARPGAAIIEADRREPNVIQPLLVGCGTVLQLQLHPVRGKSVEQSHAFVCEGKEACEQTAGQKGNP